MAGAVFVVSEQAPAADADLDEFEDAVEELDEDGDVSTTFGKFSFAEPQSTISLDVAVDHCREAINLFFDNKFEEAKAVMDPWRETSYYHALGSSAFAFLQAMLTFEHRDIKIASQRSDQSLELSNRFRRKNSSISQSLGRMLKKADYSTYTEEQIHAELCYAESLLFKAGVTFAVDETLTSFVKAGLKIRSGYQTYKECRSILKHRNWANDRQKVHFESGVRLGLGSFNLLLSFLPERILKLLQFVGFRRSSRTEGLSELEKGYQLEDGVRRVLCALVLLGYHLIVVYAMNLGEGNLTQASTIIEDQLKLKPNGAWFLFYKGRLELVQGNVNEALVWYEKSRVSQNVWPEFHHMCYWEAIFAHSMQLNWQRASVCARELFAHSRWSKCVYGYMEASFLCMIKEEGGISVEDEKRLEHLMKTFPSFKQRIAGKSIPIEKFLIRKAARYFAQGERLCLPSLELLYYWNFFPIMGKKSNLIEPCYRLVDRTLRTLEESKKDGKYHYDDLALTLLLKGCCLRWMGSPLQAEELFVQVSKMEGQILEDTYLLPFSAFELGALYKSQGKTDLAVEWLESARNNYKRYGLESKLHFWIHGALTQIREASGDDTTEIPPVLE